MPSFNTLYNSLVSLLVKENLRRSYNICNAVPCTEDGIVSSGSNSLLSRCRTHNIVSKLGNIIAFEGQSRGRSMQAGMSQSLATRDGPMEKSQIRLDGLGRGGVLILESSEAKLMGLHFVLQKAVRDFPDMDVT